MASLHPKDTSGGAPSAKSAAHCSRDKRKLRRGSAGIASKQMAGATGAAKSK